MKTFFLFHDDWTQWIKADIAASQFPFDGFVVVRKTRPWLGEYLWKRVRRIGWLKVMDQLLYRLYYRLAQSTRDDAILKTFLSEQQALIPAGYTRPPVYGVDDINSDEAERLLKGQLRPDVCVVMLNVILKERIFSIPPLGMLVFHPGLTPEYRGSHSAFWATYNRDFWGIGWSLLRVDRGIDTGVVLEQDTVRTVDPLQETHIVMQHKAHVHGIPKMVMALRGLARGERPAVSQQGRRSANYTHPGFTDFLKCRRVLRRLRLESSLRKYWDTPFALIRGRQ